MNEFIKDFIGKECIIYTMSGSEDVVSGTVREISGNWVRLENNGQSNIVNLEYVTRVREYPRKKNGKEKEIFFD